MGIFLPGRNAIRSIEWGKSFNWDIQIPDAPAPFNQWFPASSVNENKYNLTLKEFPLWHNVYSVPEGTSEFSVSITFFDDHRLTILEWLSKWVNEEILNNGRFITPLKQAAKDIYIVKTNTTGEEILRSHYWVIPKDSGFYKGESSPDPYSGEIEFVIVG